MLLAVHALGYGSCWMTGPTVAQDEFKTLLEYGEGHYIAALLLVGKSDENPSARSRKPLDELMGTVE
jgi:nitroreductase